MLPKISTEVKEKIWDYMYVSGMIFAASLGLTFALIVPFSAFSQLHTLFCN